MSSLIFAMAMAAAAVRPEVIECPATHLGKRLVGAGMYAGEQKEAELMGGRKQVRGGVAVNFGFNSGDAKWVACWYEQSPPVWHRVRPAATQCDLTEREFAPGKVKAVVRCK